MGSELMAYGGWRYEERVGGCDLKESWRFVGKID